MDRTDGLALNAPCKSAVKRPRQNRVTPFGTIEATHYKGTLMGNRGDLHATDGTLGRQWRSQRWLSCVLDGCGWKAPMDRPGNYYPLFFHDEAVALAAGHRPCGQCRPSALAAFIGAWKSGHGLDDRDWVPLNQIDRECHRARIRGGTKLHRRLSDIPSGCFVLSPEIESRPLLLFADHLWPWQHGGYGEPIPKSIAHAICLQITPEPIVASLHAGYSTMVTPNLQRVATVLV